MLQNKSVKIVLNLFINFIVFNAARSHYDSVGNHQPPATPGAPMKAKKKVEILDCFGHRK